MGPIKPITPGTQYQYLLVVTDDFSRYVITKPLRTKDETPDKLVETINALEKTTNNQYLVSQIQADWSDEFRNKELATELRQRGITLKETVPHYSGTNAIAESMNRTIFTMNRTAIIASGLPKSLWDTVSAWSAYTKNRVPHKSLNGTTPVEVFLKKDPVIERSNLRPFGQKVTCFDYEVQDKLSKRSYEGRIMGYITSFGTYQVKIPSGAYKLAKNPKPIQDEENSQSETESEEEVTAQDTLEGALQKQLQKESSTTIPQPPPAPKKRGRTNQDWEALVGHRLRSTRERRITEKAQTYVVGADPDHPTDEQARNSPQASEWAKAHARERAQLEKYGVFTKVNKLPEGVKPVDTKWVYGIKRKPDGSIEKYKARKVGRGFTQEVGINYDETYSQMMRTETFKILLIIALHKGWDIRQWDVVAAYLQATLKYEIYVTDINENGVTEYWLLHKALYGLKQSGHEWYKMLSAILNNVGYDQYIGDEGCFRSESGKNCKSIIGTHVDDMLGIGPSEMLDDIELGIEYSVELDTRGRPRKMLGMELTWEKDAVILTQRSLIESMTQTHSSQRINGERSIPGKGSSLPLDPKLFLPDNEETDQKRFQSIVGG